MSQNNDLWYFVWNTTLNSDNLYNITISFNDTNGFSNTDTLLNVTVDNTIPKIFNGNTTKNSRNFIASGASFDATVNATDVNIFNVTCTLDGTTIEFTSKNGNNYTCSLTAPSNENDFTITFTAIDKSNNTNTTTTSFTTKKTTAASLVPEDITITDLTNENKLVNLTATLSNTGSNTVYEPGVKLEDLDSTFPGSIVTGYTACNVSSLAPGESCKVNLTINVNGGNTGTFNAFWNANWTESSFTTMEFTQDKTSKITLTSNPVIDVAESVSETISQGIEKNITYHINSSGNVELSNVVVTYIPGNLTVSQVTFISPSTFTIVGSDNATLNITLTVPTATSSGTYEGKLSVSADSATTKTTNVSVTVPQDTTWTSSPSNVTVYKKNTDSGTAATITVTNEGNVDMNFSISYEGSLFKKLMLSPVVVINDIFVNKNSAATFDIDHNANGPLTEYDLNVTITNQLTSETNKTTIKLIQDNDNPNVNITAPLNNSFVKGDVDFNVSATDLNLSRIEYSIDNNLVLNSSEINFTFNWSTTNGSYPDGTYSLKAIAFDSAGNSNTSNIVVTVNNTDDLPFVANALVDFSFDEDTVNDSINLSNVFGTIDGDALAYTSSINTSNVSVAIVQNTGVVTLTPISDFFGVVLIEFNASDAANNIASDDVLVTVNNVQDIPTLPNLTFPENDTNYISAQNTVNLQATSEDADFEDLTFKFYFSNDSNDLPVIGTDTTQYKSVNPGTLEQISGNFVVNNLESGKKYFWVVETTDGINDSGNSTMSQFTYLTDSKPEITSWEWNTSTEISSSETNIVIDEDESIEFNASVSDADGDDLEFDWGLCEGEYDDLGCAIQSSGSVTEPSVSFTYRPGFSDNGTKVIRLTITDNNSNSVRQDWNLTIQDNNRKPNIILQIPDQEIVEDSTNNPPINLSKHFSDLDTDNTLTFLVEGQNVSEVVCSIVENNLTMTPAPDFAGIDTKAANCSIAAFDGKNKSINNSFLINVTNVDDIPSLDAIGSLNAQQGTLFYFDVNATDPDVEFAGDVLVFSSNSTLFTINSATGEFSFTPTNNEVGTHVINFTVKDANNEQDSEIVTLTIGNLNDAPVLDTISDQSAVEDSILEFNVTATDPDSDSLTFTSNITSISFTNAANNSMATASFTPTNDDVGTQTVNVTVGDGSVTDSKTLTITVSNTNDAPTITSFSPLSDPTIAAEVESQQFSVSFNGVDIGKQVDVSLKDIVML